MLDKEPEEFRETRGLWHIWQIFYQDKLALASFYLFLLLIITALFHQFIAPYGSNEQFIGFELLPPSWSENGKIAYFLGTDDIGRDILSRLIGGTTYTFGTALLVVLFTSVLGGVLGIWAGLSQGLKSRILGHFFDSFLSIPILLIAIIIATLMQPSLINAMLSITLALLPYFIHEIYQAVQQELKKEYILMLRLDGASDWLLVKETILPNIAIRYIREITRAFIIAIVDISALSFISLGAQRPTPEWGVMIKDYMDLIYLAPWATILPGVAIIITIVIVLIMANGLCKAIEKYYE